MWSDPEEIPGWAVSPRGAGYLFGYDATNEVRVSLIIDDVMLLMIMEMHYAVSCQ
jgi:diadenosine tetraphosphatase ApaH/serine/threonine PP2A family protein phosphatase